MSLLMHSSKRAKPKVNLVALFTDFGAQGPYLGQMQAVLAFDAPDTPVIDLLSEAPVLRPRAAAYLLAAIAEEMPEGILFLAVVDPGVGGERAGLVLQTERHWFVGPDNGLLAQAVRRSRHHSLWHIDWQPARLSASFHGRDLFAPVAAQIARGGPVPGVPVEGGAMIGVDWADDLPEIIFIDHYGNAFTGLRASAFRSMTHLVAGGRRLECARTFSEVAPGAAFWYKNSYGLVEIAVNQGRADQVLGLKVGDPVSVEICTG